MLYNINPLCHAGQAGNPKAALRIGDYKIMTWCYEVAGIGGASTLMMLARQLSCVPAERIRFCLISFTKSHNVIHRQLCCLNLDTAQPINDYNTTHCLPTTVAMPSAPPA